MATAFNRHPITIEQYLDFKSPAGYRDELVYGRIIVSPDPKAIHVDVAENIHELLKKLLGKKYRVAQRINLRFPSEHSMPSPDVFVIEREAWKQALLHKNYPDGSRVRLVVEVLSPGNDEATMRLKVKLYLKHLIEVWVVDPDCKEIKVHTAKEVLKFAVKTDENLPLPSSLGDYTVALGKIFKPSI